MKVGIGLVRAYLRWLAVVRLHRERPRIIAVTGSVGKTTTKEAIFAVLAAHFGDRVRHSAGNMNTEEGVPLAILGFNFVPTRFQYPLVMVQALGHAFFASHHAELFVLELSAEKPADIEYLVGMIKPWLAVGVVTNVGPIHLNPGQFSSVEAIAREKGVLIEALPRSGWAVLNKDNPYTKAMARRTPAKVVWFTEEGVDTAFAIAKRVGKILEVPEKEIRTALAHFQRPYGRLNELAGVKGSRLIDDSYNANPMSMEQALQILSRQAGRRIAVLGDMLELGGREQIFHEQIGRLARTRTDIVVGVGRRSVWYQPTYLFASPAQAASFLKKFVRRGDCVLVKGSQNMRMEIVSEALLANAGEAERLPRQTPAWRAKSFVQP